MGQQKSNQKLSIIVPAYNEAGRIERVLDILSTYKNCLEVIVIDDGSTDSTKDSVVRFKNVRYLNNKKNFGKGYSMDRGVKVSRGDVVFFCDADVTGLTHKIIDEVCAPVLGGEVDMFVAMRNRKIYYLHQFVVLAPLVGGERAVSKKLWKTLPDYYKHYFRIEAGLNFYARHYSKGFHYKVFRGMSQVTKEKKYGIVSGLKQRKLMFSNIIAAQFKLQFLEIPATTKERRFLSMVVLQSLLGLIIGVMFLAASYYGPYSFVDTLFAEDLRQDPSTPIIDALLRIAGVTASSTAGIIGMLLFVANIFTLGWALKKLGTVMQSLRIRARANKSGD